MGSSNSTQQAQATQQQAAEQFFQTMLNNAQNRQAGMAAAPVSKWGNIQGPSQAAGTMSRGWNPPSTPLMRSLYGNLRGSGLNTPRGQGKV